jgi:NAD(P)-dependent dehydrogenase (short-subunit alcohol dehydrogenase family)
MPSRPLEGRVALVTGAGRGLGRAHALALAAAGATVVVNDIDASPAAEVAEEVTGRGGLALRDSTDVASIGGGRRAVEVAIDAFGRIDVLVNNAGFALGGGSVGEPVEDGLDGLMAVHYRAAVGTMAAAFGDMRKRRWGRVINTVSEAALDRRFVGSLGYGAAKAALWSATLTAAAEGAPDGITVNGISPAARTRLNADLIDNGFRDGASDHLDLDPAHVAVVVVYLATEQAGDVTGRIIHAGGGQIREYTTVRTARSELVDRLVSGLGVSEGA